MFIMYYGCLSMITPPVAIGAFAAANLAGADAMRTGFSAMRFGWTIFVIPFMFVFSGTLLGYGDPVLIALDFFAACAGVWFFSASVMGYARRPLGLVARLLYGVTGLFLVTPLEASVHGRWINLAGAALAVVLFAADRFSRRALAKSERAAG
jgi:TRAP-type uncharacterized transport system fused permease subunit